MNEYSANKAAQQKVADSAAALSGQDLSGSFPSSEPLHGVPLIQAWAREAQDIIEFWLGYLSSDRDDPIDLTEISGIKISMQSLREGLTKYLFEGDAQLRNTEPSAWAGIQKHWILVKLNSDTLWTEIVYYRDWMTQIDKRGDQITDPMAMRKMARTMRDDTHTIVDLYNKLACNLLPIIKEILEFP
jgi:hypothetical protein